MASEKLLSMSATTASSSGTCATTTGIPPAILRNSSASSSSATRMRDGFLAEPSCGCAIASDSVWANDTGSRESNIFEPTMMSRGSSIHRITAGRISSPFS